MDAPRATLTPRIHVITSTKQMASIIDAVTDALQERLVNPKKPYARRLAELLVANSLHTPLEKLVPLDAALNMAHDGLRDYVRSNTALKVIGRTVDQQLELLKGEDRPIHEIIPPQLVKAMRQWARRPWSPGSRSLLKALDQAPVKDLLARLIVRAVVDFTAAGRSPKRRKARQGLDALLVSFGQDLGERLQAKAEEFAQKAVAGVLDFIVDELANPKRAKQQAALRESILTGLLSIEADELAKEVDKFDVTGAAELIRDAIGDWLETEEGERAFTIWLRGILEPQWHRPFGDIVRENGLDRAAKHYLPQIVESRVRAFAESEEFRRFVKDVATD